MPVLTPADATGLPQLSFREFGLWLLRRRQRFRVQERSMLPVLAPGDEILVDMRAYRLRTARVGEIVVVRLPGRPINQVKRVGAILPGGRLFIKGDNAAESRDSRHYGPVTTGVLLGKVVCHFG